MGWTCQHDHQGYCKLLSKPCVPGINGCILKKSDGIVFSSGNLESDKKQENKEDTEIDFAKLAREN